MTRRRTTAVTVMAGANALLLKHSPSPPLRLPVHRRIALDCQRPKPRCPLGSVVASVAQAKVRCRRSDLATREPKQ